MKKRYLIISLALIAVCFSAAIITRASYRNDLLERIQNYSYFSNDKLQNVSDKEKIHSPDDLIRQSDVIVKCRFSGNRRITDEAFYTPVSISDIYKGNTGLKGKTITIVETVETVENEKITPKCHLLLSESFYIPLQKKNDYILLLKKLPLNPAEKADAFLDSQYYPVAQSAFGVYRISDMKQTKLIDVEKENIPFHQLSKFDLFATKQNELDTYYRYKQQIFEKIGI